MVFRRGSRLNVIHSVKHVVDSEGVWTSAASRTDLAKVVNARTTPFDPLECEVGETVNGIFLSIFAIGDTGAPVAGSVNWYICKIRSGQGATTPLAGSTGTSDFRNQIFHEEKGVPGSGDGTPMVFKGVVVIPKGFRRMREGDFFAIIANTTTASQVNFCIKAIYKSFS